jgi:hypothetical protein
MKLSEYADPLAWDTAFWLMGFRDPGMPLEESGRRSTELCRKLRALAIIALVGAADVDAFHHNLIRSGGVRERYLTMWRRAGREDDHDDAASRLDGWLDALAAGDLELASRIARLSPARWHESREYEDDFELARALFSLLPDPPTGESTPAALARLDAALEGRSDPRRDVAAALADRDQTAFDAAFEALLVDRERAITDAIARGQMDDPIVVAHRMVYVEGLAMLRLAEVAGLATQREYRLCPSLARQPMRTPYPGE